MSFLRPILSTSWLHGKLPNLPRNLKILDTSWTAVKSGHENYLSKHIPQAMFFDLNHCVKASPTLPRNLPEPLCFRDYVRSLGISTDSHIVVYDRGGILPSARTWWMFRVFGHDSVSVLDGGLRKWEADGFETNTGEETPPQSGDFTVKMQWHLTKNYDAVNTLAASQASVIVDARRPEHFDGKEPEPTNFTKKALEGMRQPIPTNMASGHIPGSVNVLEDLVLNKETKCLLSEQQLNQLWADKGIDLKKPITTLCYNGHAACLLALAMAACGKTDTSVYYGSWTEYGQRIQSVNTKFKNIQQSSTVKAG